MKDNQYIIGSIGEDLVTEHFKFSEKTDDWYDSTKDGTIQDFTYEVKTMRLNFRDNGFWIHENQWKKVDGVDLLFFVKVPEKEEEGLRLYQMLDHKRTFKMITHKGKKVRVYPFTRCLLLDIIYDNRALQVLEASKSISTWSRVA